MADPRPKCRLDTGVIQRRAEPSDTADMAGAAIALIFAAWMAGVIVLLKCVGSVWRGDRVRWLPMIGLWMSGPRVNNRSFPAWAVSIFWFWTASCLLAVEAVDREGALRVAVGLCGLVWLVTFPLWLIVNALNRPRFLVPPGRRREKGSWPRRRAGLAPTDHPVEILDVRPATGDPKPYPPYFVAVCTNDDCDWMSDVVDQDGSDAETAVQAQARDHSDVLIGTRRPVG